MNTILRVNLVSVLLLAGLLNCFSQNSSKSILINHGGTSCGSDAPQQQFFTGTLTSNPAMVASCDVGLPYYSVLAAYNPADHKVYFAYMPGNTTSVYALDFNFGGAINCPSAATPTYVYNYSLNQLCFDNNGNNYALYNFDPTAGTAHLVQVDITTGNFINGTDKLIQFPANNIPNSVLFGDIVILPNGRMFASFGNAPSKLFEITNISGPGNAAAVYLTDLPRQCFSIGYVDGSLTIAGSDGGGCYYYIWDINNLSLSTAYPFPLSKNSSDMSNLTVAVGTTKELMGSINVNDTTAYLYYQIVVKNKGNVFLNNVQVKDDLARAFGATISNVSIAFVSNPAGLQLNPNYDGVNDVNLLAANQTLNNYPTSSDSAVIKLVFMASGLSTGVTYYNSAISSGDIGTGANYLAVSDSSNNGDASMMDLNGNGISDDAGENVPTPFMFNYELPLNQLRLSGTRNDGIVKLNWNSIPNVLNYEVQRSIDGKLFQTIGTVDQNRNGLNYTDNISQLPSQHLYYRLRLNKMAGYVYSNTLEMQNMNSPSSVGAFPNPFIGDIRIQARSEEKANGILIIRDITGRVLLNKTVPLEKGTNYFTVTEVNEYLPGTYIMEIDTKAGKSYLKLVKNK